MKYNILTVASKSYYPFLDVFLNSLFKNGNTEDLNKLYIVDIGLGKYRNNLLKSDKIVYLDADHEDVYSGVHSSGWYKNVSAKTRKLKYVLENSVPDEPLIMIDSDVLILGDISELIDLNFDMQFTTMSAGSHLSASGVEISEIACFVICNNIKKSLEFVELWIKTVNGFLEERRLPPHETPAMNLLLRRHEFVQSQSLDIDFPDIINDFKIGYLDENIACSDLIVYPNSKTLHFKSNGGTQANPVVNFIYRIQKVKSEIDGFDLKDINSYLNIENFNYWSAEYN
jgi:hypothetical protein